MPSSFTQLVRVEAQLLRLRLLAALRLARRPKPPITHLDPQGCLMIPPIEFDPAHPELGPAVDVLARTAWGENRGGGQDGMQSVINAVMNRVAHPGWWGNSALSVCLMREQFSCWLPSDTNRAQLLAVTTDDPQYLVALGLAKKALSAEGLDAPDRGS